MIDRIVTYYEFNGDELLRSHKEISSPSEKVCK
jgi:hypothetical protein